MKKAFILIVSAILFALVSLSLKTTTAFARTDHCGTVGDETWTGSGNVHVLTCDVTVASGSTLTIEQGAIVKVNLDYSLIVNGALRILGTSGNHAIFTSIKDDTFGGDTNEDGAATSPDHGDWESIRFNDSSDDGDSLIEYAEIYYAGETYYDNAGIRLNNASPTIRYSTVSSSAGNAIGATVCSFPVLNGNTFSNNGVNGLGLDGGTVCDGAIWDVTSTAYYLHGDVSVNANETLTLNPGVVVKFGGDYSIIVKGTLKVLGASTKKVNITSGRDDTLKGDTNGDGGATNPSPGDWESIRFEDSSNDANSLIDYAIIRYGGEYYYDQANIRLNNASPTIQNTAITYSDVNAIGATLCSFPVLTGNTFSNNGINGLGLDGGTVCNGSVWGVTNTAYYLRGDVAVNVNETLTVNPGVVVKFGDDYSIIVKGTLKVLGTSTNKVFITSGRDDMLKGDTNGDGGASSPARGDWESIRFEDTSNDANSLIEYAVVRYGGEYYYDRANIRLNNASPTIRNSTIAYSGNNAIGATLCSFPILTNNTFSNNEINGLGLDGGTVCNGAVWKVTNTAYYLTGNATVNSNETLTVNPGVVVKFGDDYSIIVKGTLKVLGTSLKKVVFTSGRDDTLKGDTNGDGGATSPYPGDWGSIRFEDTSNDANSLIKYAVIRYGGEYYYDNAAIKLNSASPTIRFTTIESNRTGIAANNSKPKARCNNIRSNQELGIRNETTGVILKAENNWWGAVSGPYHAGTNPSGGGNAVTDGVDYKPWLVKPFTDPCIDLIFADGFESGTFTNWSSKVVDGGDLSVTTAAKLVGQYGMKANIDDTTAIFVTDDNPVTEKEYWARFYFDPNAITMADGNTHTIFLGYHGTTAMNFRLEFRRSAGEYQLQIGAIQDNGVWQNSGWTKLGNYGDTTRHIIEINWVAASGAGANDGSMKLWIDEVDSKTISNLDNDTRRVDRVRLGAVDGIDSGTKGAYFFDAFESRRTSYIGPVSLEELEEGLLPDGENPESPTGED